MEWELEDIRREEQLQSRQDAIIKMIEHCRIGRELERMAKLRFGNFIMPPKLPKGRK